MMTADYTRAFTIANAWLQNSFCTGPSDSGVRGNVFLKFWSNSVNVSKMYHNHKDKKKRLGEIASGLNVPAESRKLLAR